MIFARPGRWSRTPNWGNPGTNAVRGNLLLGTLDPVWFPCVIVPDPVCFDWPGASWPSVLLFVKDIAIDWEAALASSRRLTGPVFGHEPANFAWPRTEDRRIFQGVMLA